MQNTVQAAWIASQIAGSPTDRLATVVRLFAQDIQTWAGHWSGQLGPIGFDNLKRGSVFLFWTYKTKASQ